MNLCMRAHAMATTENITIELRTVCLEVHDVDSVRQFLADEGVESKKVWKPAGVRFASWRSLVMISVLTAGVGIR